MNEKITNPADESRDAHLAQAFAYNTMVQEDEIDLLAYWDLLWSNRWLIILITSMATVVAIVVALTLTPIYKADVLLAPTSTEGSKGMSLGGLGGLASLVGVTGSLGGGGAEEALAVLKSRAFLGEFFVSESLLPILFEEQWDEAQQQWKNEDTETQPSLWDAYGAFTRGVLATSVDKDSGLVILSVNWSDPELAARWVNDLVIRLNEHMRSAAINEASKSIEYLNQQIIQTSVLEMKQMLYGLIEEETKKIMLANVRAEYAFKVIDPAVIPEQKVKPKRALIAILGMVLGLFMAVFFVFFREFIRKAKIDRAERCAGA